MLRACKSGNGDNSSAENKNPNLHKRLLTTFQGFINQLDELSLTLKAEERLSSNGYIPEFTSYQEICEKLRLEVLIAIDKLEISAFPGVSYYKTNMEFIHKMNNLKFQLTDIASQYHNAIKNFNIEPKDDKIGD